MHDFFEDVCQYDLALIFDYFIFKKLIALEVLNIKVRGFSFCYHDRQNKPPEISKDHIKNKRIILSAAKMQSLVRNLPIMIGNLIPKCSEHWQLVLKLADITDIITVNHYQPEYCDLLKCVVNEYLVTLLKLFPNSLKPKNHFLVHYTTVMKVSGALRNLSSMRGESKNKESKEFATVAINRINICYTITTKHQLKLNHYFHNFKTPDDFITGPIKNQTVVFEKFLTDNGLSKDMFEGSWLKFNDQYLTQNSIIMVPTKHGPVFYNVQTISIAKDNKALVFSQGIEAHLDEDVHAFIVINYSISYKIFFWNELKYCIVTHKIRAGNGNEYILKRWI
ncbi:uncharacterized protein [Eurosta solidaginis]|uniref:uncharacterized protein isoform X1 n=1 Tax=Eurosta solidaginis TaxID=178769 RepID=UPI00353134F9